MTSEQLIAEGRKLQRPCAFLRPEPLGPVVAWWHEREQSAESDGPASHCWLTVDAKHIPGLPSTITGYLSIFSDEEDYEGGWVEQNSSRPARAGTPLYAHPVVVLPPIDAVFARGSAAVETWLRANDWEREIRYNDNFRDAAVVAEYERIERRESPLFFPADSDVYAVLGGWHVPGPDDDWYELMDERLMVLTLRDAEPWVEAWCRLDGSFQVIQRVT